MNSTILREPYIDSKKSKYEFKLLETSSTMLSFCTQRGINLDLAKEYLNCIEKSYLSQFGAYSYPKKHIGFKNNNEGFALCLQAGFSKGQMGACINQSITTFIKNDNEKLTIFNDGGGKLYIFYDFWDFLSFLTLYPEKKEENFLVLNRHTPKDHNLQEAKNIIWRFDSVENYIKFEDVEKTDFIQEEFKKVCKQVVPRWQEFTEPNLNEFLIKKIAPK